MLAQAHSLALLLPHGWVHASSLLPLLQGAVPDGQISALSSFAEQLIAFESPLPVPSEEDAGEASPAVTLSSTLDDIRSIGLSRVKMVSKAAGGAGK